MAATVACWFSSRRLGIASARPAVEAALSEVEVDDSSRGAVPKHVVEDAGAGALEAVAVDGVSEVLVAGTASEARQSGPSSLGATR